MPSTPRMQAIEAKASQPGEPLTQAEVTEWHDRLVFEGLQQAAREAWAARKRPRSEDALGRYEPHPEVAALMLEQYQTAIRYLDSTGYRRQ